MKFTETVRLSHSRSLESGYYESIEDKFRCVICTKVVNDILDEMPEKIKITYSDRLFTLKSECGIPVYPGRIYVNLDNNLFSFFGRVNQYFYSYAHRQVKDKLFGGQEKGIRTVYFHIEKVE